MMSAQSILLLLAVLLGAILALLTQRWLGRRRTRRIFQRGRRLEHEAARWLEQRGFEVLDSQVPGELTFHIDQEAVSVSLRADYLVHKAGRKYIVEVKSGSKAVDARQSATRRQLLEYSMVFDADGLLLLDMESRSLQQIEFPQTVPGHGAKSSPWYASWVGLLVGFCCGALFFAWINRAF